MTTTIQSAATTLREPGVEFEFDEAQLAAVSFLARYSGRTLEAYRHDLRGFFQWATDNRIVVLGANRAHIELFRAWMEDRGLAASTIDRRLSTVCGFYRFAHIDGRIRSNSHRSPPVRTPPRRRRGYRPRRSRDQCRSAWPEGGEMSWSIQTMSRSGMPFSTMPGG
jgi:integrase